ncbi:hypothetical protein BN7_3865 [Wickerhamomyces ciferrii]|uniref:Protein kinase domain-containing protein n=1 Tax=Wickerhamomyces ciferrii (strain ATCC 14091 / BCRC 22168 / CBS 111 / JCM 3599 / NBRC 0793 / NRRL Y-1031 F-60-10) TaxID=1206466 RepID=K0KSK7_WICCF|nr:uncharacterized protein BN7_3865 [Wickerhamomyces ciferrii]CCH44303.1 hypothetical protein BN7_3865 [Wickerhamomyces ciferrii]
MTTIEKLQPGTKLQVGSHECNVLFLQDTNNILSTGGFAHIYTVKPQPIEDGYEIACLKRVIVKTKPELNLLRKEVDTMKKLASNKYVVKYYDSNAQKLDDGTYEVLLLMEYCPNKSLLDLMNQHLKTKLSVAQILKIMYEISIAVSAMHSVNLIHRDLKVENVLINADGDFKLADFGSTSGYIAPPKNQEEFQLVAHDILYQTTPQYRAPEMIDLYKNIPVDYKSDIWALGVFLYKLMYYTTPFEMQGEVAILHGYFQFPPAPKYPSRLKNLVIIMLQVDVNLRPNIYQVIHELSSMVEKPVPIEDFYGLGPYNYEEYAKYQQQLQYQQQIQQQQAQQAQQQQIQQQQYQTQKYWEHQKQQQKHQEELITQQVHKAAENNQQAPNPNDLRSSTASPQADHSIHPPQQLARSTNPSSGDLQSLAFESDPVKSEKTPTPLTKQPLGGENNIHVEEKEIQDEDQTGEGEEVLDNVEERYPSLEDLDEGSVEKRFPDVNTIDTDVETKARKSIDELRSEVSDAKSSVDLTRNSSRKTQTSTKTEELENEEDAPKLGIKLTHTEAWTTPAPEPKHNIDVDGVFHTESDQNEKSSPSSVPRKSGEYDARESFESGASRKSFETMNSHYDPSTNEPTSSLQQTNNLPPQQDAGYSQILVSPPSNPQPIYQKQYHPQQLENQHYPTNQESSNNPYYAYPQQNFNQPRQYHTVPQQSQQLPQNPIYSQSDPYSQQQQQHQQPRPNILGSRNPFPTAGSKNPFPSSKSSLDVKTNPIPAEKSGGNPWAQYQQNTSKLNPQQNLLLQQQKPTIKPYSTNSVPKLRNSSTLESPSIQVTPTENLIDIDNVPAPARTRDPKNQPQLNLDLLELDMSEPEAFDDDLQVEEMKVKPTRRKSSNQKPSTLPQDGSVPRKSSELNRINLDLEELNLDDENNENVLADDETGDSYSKHSRRSLSLHRSRSKTSKVSRPKDESRKSSFLGFKS